MTGIQSDIIGPDLPVGTKLAKRRRLDWYPTPEPLTLALMDFFDLPDDLAEPCAGDLSLASVLADGHDVLTGDIDPGWITDVGPLDFLDPRALDVYAGRTVATNPPFFIAPDIVRQALRVARECYMLLPLNWLEPCNNREDIVSLPGHALIFQRCKHTDFTGGGGDSKTVMWRHFNLDGEGDPTLSHVRASKLDEYAGQGALL